MHLTLHLSPKKTLVSSPNPTPQHKKHHRRPSYPIFAWSCPFHRWEQKAPLTELRWKQMVSTAQTNGWHLYVYVSFQHMLNIMSSFPDLRSGWFRNSPYQHEHHVHSCSVYIIFTYIYWYMLQQRPNQVIVWNRFGTSMSISTTRKIHKNPPHQNCDFKHTFSVETTNTQHPIKTGVSTKTRCFHLSL